LAPLTSILIIKVIAAIHEFSERKGVAESKNSKKCYDAVETYHALRRIIIKAKDHIRI